MIIFYMEIVMYGTKTIDGSNKIDWGKTSEDYARFRPGPPPSFYQKLKALEVGLVGQDLLDLGTGTGVLAREFAKGGCRVTATDISMEQIEMARELSSKDGLDIDFRVMPSEEVDFPSKSFDVITANQCFLYFDKKRLIPILKKILKDDGVFVTSHFSWMPFLDPVAKSSEDLILKHNSKWSAHSYAGEIPIAHESLVDDFNVCGFFYYDEKIPFTHETWRGRIRASRGIGASLDQEKIKKFDEEHIELLKDLVPDEFSVIHRIDAHIMRVK